MYKIQRAAIRLVRNRFCPLTLNFYISIGTKCGMARTICVNNFKSLTILKVQNFTYDLFCLAIVTRTAAMMSQLIKLLDV